MSNLVHYSEYLNFPARVKMNVSQLEALSALIQVTEVTELNALELNAVRDIMQKIYLKVQRRILNGVSTRISFSASELWALSHISNRIPEKTYASLALYPLIELIDKRK